MRNASFLLVLLLPVLALAASGGDLKGTHDYDDFDKPAACRACHTDIFRQWEQSMMSQAYTHHWDEVEYFQLAVAHTENSDDYEAGVHEGCNGCHTPMAFMAGDVPPPRPGESRADESVSCDICHTITGKADGTPFNFNYTIEPGNEKRANRSPDEAKPSPRHEMVKNEFLSTPEFCGTCHNEQSPHGAWVKATQTEFADGPYAAEGRRCHDCHMTWAPGRSAKMGNEHEDVAQHLFHGGHDPGKVNGVIELRIHPDIREVEVGETVQFNLALFNQKTGHMFPTGSVEDRLLWVEVVATDAAGNDYRLPVDVKGFDGEEWTIANDDLAYWDMAVPLDDPDFKGVSRDGGIPNGSRIFRMPYLNPDGDITIMQWHTASFGPDYRMGPRETKLENYTFEVPFEAAPGRMTVTATMYYSLLVPSVADLLGVPEEGEAMVVNSHSTTVTVID